MTSMNPWKWGEGSQVYAITSQWGFYFNNSYDNNINSPLFHTYLPSFIGSLSLLTHFILSLLVFMRQVQLLSHFTNEKWRHRKDKFPRLHNKVRSKARLLTQAGRLQGTRRRGAGCTHFMFPQMDTVLFPRKLLRKSRNKALGIFCADLKGIWG